MASIKPSKLETATKNTKDFKQQVQEPPEVITEDSQATQMWLKNDATNMEKSRAPAATRDKGNVTNCIYSNNLRDSYNSVITPTDQIDRILGFFFERYNREIESTQNKHELLQKELGNMDGRLDIYIDVLTSTPVCSLADFLSFTMTQGDKNAEGGITDKLDLLIKRMSERFRETGIGTSQREAETIQGTENIQTVSIMSDRRTGKTSPPQLCQLTNCQSNTQSKSAKSLISPEKHATKSVCTQTIEIASVQVAKTDQRNPTNCKIPDEPGITKGAVAPKGRILRSAANDLGFQISNENNWHDESCWIGCGDYTERQDPKKEKNRRQARVNKITKISSEIYQNVVEAMPFYLSVSINLAKG
ncbi:Non-reducing end alpha-L-arabinofuranosidase BoGH43A [Fusarium oxysporum f. sp. albedinis]|nr:Non-reducing end alpha-L-arabinofuranosidase BoGH43A [Fusarium oxysporum f. sp. albedinis]